MKKTKNNIIFLMSFLLIWGQIRAEEGMYPINTIHNLPLNQAGMKISTQEIMNGSGGGLVTAIVQLGGCTGSFVSESGLIISNHHCTFGTLQSYSTPSNNLLEKGYLAENREKELPLKGLRCRIMKSYKDVSQDVLNGTEKESDALQKKKIIQANIEAIKLKEKVTESDYQIDVSEMLPGKSYMLFKYFIIKDIRMVFIPARNIGEFGGESDNWAWPRHTGDFSFVRAYVSKEGKGDEYNIANVPYKPQEYLSINVKEKNENDFLFLLGYPGRTYRHQPSAFLKYHKEVLLPYTSELYEWEIEIMNRLGKEDSYYAIQTGPKIKSLANTMKNYKGKLKSIKVTHLLEQKQNEEKQIEKLLSSKPTKLALFQNTVSQLNSLYDTLQSKSLKFIWASNLLSESKIIRFYADIYRYADGVKNQPSQKAKLFAKYNPSIRNSFLSLYREYDSIFLKKMLQDSKEFTHKNSVIFPQTFMYHFASTKRFSKFLDNIYLKHKWLDTTHLFETMKNNPEKLLKQKEPIIDLVSYLTHEFESIEKERISLNARIDAVIPYYLDCKMEALGKEFIPDANSTLRLTYGKIKGYEPADATYFYPFTSAKGMLEKNGTQEDYKINIDIAELLKKNGFGIYKSKDANDVPLCMLYNTDTTGGNSGSPVLNANGELIALNFDRTFEATINDYGYNEKISRSIGLDMRFVLWVTTRVVDAQYLVREMHIVY